MHQLPSDGSKAVSRKPTTTPSAVSAHGVHTLSYAAFATYQETGRTQASWPGRGATASTASTLSASTGTTSTSGMPPSLPRLHPLGSAIVRVGVVAEQRAGERRVALVPDAVGKLLEAGLEVAVERGAGAHAFATDEAYRDAGAEVVDDVLASSDVVLTVSPLTTEQARRLRPGALTLGFLPVAANAELLAALRERQVLAFAMEQVPRISRAQSMDALSSQALVAGYRAALVAAERLPRFFPLFMTAAGTVPPAKVLVLGAGVAGLQAIATARRLGAVVEAYDVRAASADEVRSMGATFLDLDLEALEGAGGYAREMARGPRRPPARAAHAVRRASPTPSSRPPRCPAGRRRCCVTRAMVEAMRPGSVVVDLAAESGGNCELSGRAARTSSTGGVLGARHGATSPSSMPVHASQLYATQRHATCCC